MTSWQTTHPWITFRLPPLDRLPSEVWLLAGEVISKCEHVAGVPLLHETALDLMQVYLSKGAQATTAIEGNTLTEEEVRQRINQSLVLPPSKEYLGIEIDNIVTACNAVLKGAAEAVETDGDTSITPETIMAFNEACLANLELEEHVRPGRLRQYSVGVGDYRAVPYQSVGELLSRLCQWLNQPWFGELQAFCKRDRQRLEAVFKAIMAHLYIAWIHPFGDGNGRTARLVEFYILVNAGIPFPSAHLLSNHYNETRSDYYRQLSHASKSGGEIIPFCFYALRGLTDQLREQIARIRLQQQKQFWKAQVELRLKGAESQTGRRRKHLVLDLYEMDENVSRRQLLDISPYIARTYARLDEKTLVRDLEILESLELIENDDGKYRAKKELVLAYLPPAKVAD